MNKELIVQMQSQFDALARIHPDAAGVEFWFARDLQEPFGYARWENFLTAIQRAIFPHKDRGECAVRSVPHGEPFLDRLQARAGRCRQRPLHLFAVFFGFETAGGVDQASARRETRQHARQNLLLHGAELLQSLTGKTPAGIGSPAQHACIGTGNVQQNTVKSRGVERGGCGGVALDHLHPVLARAVQRGLQDLQAIGIQVHCDQAPLSGHAGRQLRGLAAGRGTGVEHGHARSDIEQIDRRKRSRVLHDEPAFPIAGEVFDPHAVRDQQTGFRRRGVGCEERGRVTGEL